MRQRVQRLLDAGMVQIVAVTDPLQVGFQRQAMIGVRCSGPLEPVADALVTLDEVDYVRVYIRRLRDKLGVVCHGPGWSPPGGTTCG